MTTIRTGTALTHRDIRRLEQGGYELVAVETHEKDDGADEIFIWGREDELNISEYALPF